MRLNYVVISDPSPHKPLFFVVYNFMFKSFLLIGSLLLFMGILVKPVDVNAMTLDALHNVKRAIADSIDYSRETETCINLRGCGRRDQT